QLETVTLLPIAERRAHALVAAQSIVVERDGGGSPAGIVECGDEARLRVGRIAGIAERRTRLVVEHLEVADAGFEPPLGGQRSLDSHAREEARASSGLDSEIAAAQREPEAVVGDAALPDRRPRCEIGRASCRE